MVFVKDELEKKLVSIQVNGSPSQITPKHRDLVGAAVGEVHLLLDILMKTDAYVRGRRRDEGEGLPPQFRQSMIDQLRFLPGYFAEGV
jgi:hypothetical protein